MSRWSRSASQWPGGAISRFLGLGSKCLLNGGGQTIPAIRFVVTDREVYRPVRTSLLLIDEIRRQHRKEFAWGKSIDRLTGSDKVRLAIDGGTLPALLEQWDREAAAFRERRWPFLLYD